MKKNVKNNLFCTKSMIITENPHQTRIYGCKNPKSKIEKKLDFWVCEPYALSHQPPHPPTFSRTGLWRKLERKKTLIPWLTAMRGCSSRERPRWGGGWSSTDTDSSSCALLQRGVDENFSLSLFFFLFFFFFCNYFFIRGNNNYDTYHSKYHSK